MVQNITTMDIIKVFLLALLVQLPLTDTASKKAHNIPFTKETPRCNQYQYPRTERGQAPWRTTTGNKLVPDEQRLLQKLFRNYDNSVRPVYNATTSVVVRFGLALVQIMDMSDLEDRLTKEYTPKYDFLVEDEKNQVLVSNVWLTHEWFDERIQWDPKDYNNLEMVRIPAKKLWLPDIVLYNNADDFTTGYMPSNAMVSNQGEIFWSPPARLLSSCKVDITYFPFDDQTCDLKFGSWTYEQAQVDIVNSSDLIDMSNYISNGEWALKGTRIVRNEVVYPIGTEVYPDVTVSFIIHRRILYYILNIILPCIWLNMLSLLAFCLPPDAGEKITLGITVLLSYSVFMLLVAENMPPTSEFVPLIGIYLTISMAVTSISVILTVCVLKLHHCGPHQSEVPRWMRTVVLGFIAGLVRCRCLSDTSKKKRRRTTPKETMGVKESSDVCLRLMSELNHSRKSPITDIRHNHTANNVGTTNCITSGNASRTTFSNKHMPTTHLGKPEQQYSRDLYGVELQRLQTLQEILKYLKFMVSKRDEDDRENDIVNEWRQVAQVMDRFLFWFFFLLTGIATLVIMVLVPMMRYMKEER